MKLFFRWILFFIFGQPCVNLMAQSPLYTFTNPVVVSNGKTLPNPWFGGLDNVQCYTTDVNDDQINDLIIFDRINTKTHVWACDINGAITTRLINLELNLPELKDWVVFTDYNCDGLVDIFTYKNRGVVVYKNIGSASFWNFELVTDDLQTFNDFGDNSYFSNIGLSSIDMPIIEDLDEDGDLDILTFSLVGDKIEFHKNFSMENYGHCDSLPMALKNRCWGYIEENDFDNGLTLGDSDCSFNVVDPERRARFPASHQFPYKKIAGSRHVGSTLCNLSETGINELLIGDVSFPNMGKVDIVTNEIARDSAINLTPNFPVINPISLTNFPAAFKIKRNNTNRELIVSPFALSGSNNTNSVWRYALESGNWVFKEDDFLQKDMLDMGSVSNASWYDFTGDNIPDLVFGNQHTFSEESDFSSLQLFENTGNITQPEFNQVNSNWLNLKADQYTSLHPTFGDLNGDDKPDLIIGNKEGTLLFYQQSTSSSGSDFNLVQAQLKDVENKVIDVGLFSTPCIVDVDGDQLNDLLIGKQTGTISFYRNIGNTTSPIFELVSDHFGAIDVKPVNALYGYATPSVFKFNNKLMLVIGNDNGEFAWYQINSETSVIEQHNFPTNFNTGNRSSLSIFNNDEKLLTVIGNKSGGYNFLALDNTLLSVNKPTKKQNNKLKVYPNPSSSIATLEVPTAFDNAKLIVLNVATGQTLMEERVNSGIKQINTSSLPVGVYIIKLQKHSRYIHAKLIIHRE